MVVAPLFQLYPADAHATTDAPGDMSQSALAQLYDFPAFSPGSSWLRANMISTVDGAASGPDGSSSSINNSSDFRVFEMLRALCDVVVVAAGTVRAEGYAGIHTPPHLANLRSELGLTPHPALVIVSASGQVPWQTLMAVKDYPLPFVVTSATGARALPSDFPRAQLGVLPADVSGWLSAPAIMEWVVAQGWSRVQLEGGPRLLGQFVNAGLVDELCLTIAPHLFPGAPTRITELSDDPAAFQRMSTVRLAHVLVGANTLLTRWLVERSNPQLARP